MTSCIGPILVKLGLGVLRRIEFSSNSPPRSDGSWSTDSEQTNRRLVKVVKPRTDSPTSHEMGFILLCVWVFLMRKFFFFTSSLPLQLWLSKPLNMFTVTYPGYVNINVYVYA